MFEFPCNLDIVACLTLFDKDIRFCLCPDQHKRNLENAMRELKSNRDVVTTKIREQERHQPLTTCKVEVKGWLDRVNDTENQVNTLLDDLKNISSCTYCFSCHNYGLGKDVVDLITLVNSLMEQNRNFDYDNLVSRYDPIDSNVPYLRTTMVGRDGKSSEIHRYLRDSQVTTIGIWGRGGIGKTALMLKSIEQWSSQNSDHNLDGMVVSEFHYMIWIKFEMSQNDDDILEIQKRIAECTYHSLPSEHEERENAAYLHSVLQSRKSLLLIDNVWKKLDFVRIGIPFAVGTVVKILFTTRSEIVCHDMMQGLEGKKVVHLDSLDEAESLKLFNTNINPNVDLTDKIVHRRVHEILKICGGLPLLIVTVARKIPNNNGDVEWDHAVNSLRSYEGMDDIIECLMFTNDNSGNLRRRLLYLSLYREGAEIYTDEIIKEWIAEGFLDTSNDNSFRKSYIREVEEINKLKSICLVEKSVYSDDCVKLHDVIRPMLCRIREQDHKEEFIVYNDQISDCNYDRWDLAKRICLLERHVRRLPETGMPLCPNLKSLLVEYEDYPNRIDRLPTEIFFNHTPSLRVLNLSGTGLVDIPRSIGELVELRYLNLFRTRIRTLPVELGKLKKLKFLNLGDTLELVTIVGSAISQLSELQSLNLCNTSYQWKSDDVDMETECPLLKLEDLRALQNLEELGVDVRSNSHLNKILCDQMLLRSIARISFIRINFTTFDLGVLRPIEWISQRLQKLKDLIVDRCTLGTDILEIKDGCDMSLVTRLYLWRLEISSVTLNDTSRPFSRLKVLQILGCQWLKEVSWTARIPSLEKLIVDNCNSVKVLVEEEIREERHYFPKLYYLKIKNLENLERIHRRSPLLFPALRHLIIQNCPTLKQLSFDDDSAKNLEYIKCERNQWDLLEWENDQFQAKFSPYVRASI